MTTPRRRNSSDRSILFQLSVIALGTAAASLPALGSSVAYEGFEYASSSTLASQNGGSGFSGAWTATSGVSTVGSAGLSYGSMSVTGNRATTPAQNTTFSRSLLTPLGSTTSTYYFSFILRPDYTYNSSSAEFALAGSSANLYVGKPTTGNYYGLDTVGSGSGGSQNLTSTTYANGTTVLMVLRADFVSGGADTFKLYINPNLNAEPSSADATKSGYEVGTVSGIQFTGNLGYSFDEFRIGTSYGDVTTLVPESDTWVAGFVLTGGIVGSWFRARQRGKTRQNTH